MNKKYGKKNIFNRNYEKENLQYFERCVKKGKCTDCQKKIGKEIPGCGRDILMNTLLNKRIQEVNANPKGSKKIDEEKGECKHESGKQGNKKRNHSKEENESDNEEEYEEYACGDCVLFWQYNNWQPTHGGLKISGIDGKMIEVSTRDDITYGTFEECNIAFYPFGNMCNTVAESRLVIDESNKHNWKELQKWNGRHLCAGHARKYVPPGRKAIESEGSKALLGKFIMFDVDAFPFCTSQSMDRLVSGEREVPPGMQEMMKKQKGHIIHQFRFAKDLPVTITDNGTAGMECSESEEESNPKTIIVVESDSSDCAIIGRKGNKRSERDSGEVINTESDVELVEDSDLGHSSNDSFIVKP